MMVYPLEAGLTFLQPFCCTYSQAYKATTEVVQAELIQQTT